MNSSRPQQGNKFHKHTLGTHHRNTGREGLVRPYSVSEKNAKTKIINCKKMNFKDLIHNHSSSAHERKY